MVGVRGCGDERAICSSMWIWASIYNIYVGEFYFVFMLAGWRSEGTWRKVVRN